MTTPSEQLLRCANIFDGLAQKFKTQVEYEARKLTELTTHQDPQTGETILPTPRPDYETVNMLIEEATQCRLKAREVER